MIIRGVYTCQGIMEATMAKCGVGNLFRITDDKAFVEFDYMYLVELPLEDIVFIEGENNDKKV